MKNFPQAILCTLFVLLFIGISPRAFSGDKKITKKNMPTAALKTFEAAFPKVKVNVYLTESENGKILYEFETFEETIKRDILYTPGGTLDEVEDVLTTKTIPAEIAKAITTEMYKSRILGGKKTTKGSEVTFDVKIKFKKTGKVILSTDGKIIKREWKK